MNFAAFSYGLSWSVVHRNTLLFSFEDFTASKVTHYAKIALSFKAQKLIVHLIRVLSLHVYYRCKFIRIKTFAFVVRNS